MYDVPPLTPTPLYFLNKPVSYLFHIIFCPFVYISVDAGGNIWLQFCYIHLKVWSSQALWWLQRKQNWQHGERQRKLKLEKDNGDLNRNNNGACVLQNHRQQPPFTLTNFQKCWISVIPEICKAPTLRLKALNKHNITHIMYIEMENVGNLTKS